MPYRRVAAAATPVTVVAGARERKGIEEPCFVTTSSYHRAVGYGDTIEESVDDFSARLKRGRAR